MQAVATATVPAEASRHRLPGYPWQDVKRLSGYFPRRPRSGSTYQSKHAGVATGPSPHRVHEFLLTYKIQRVDIPFQVGREEDAYRLASRLRNHSSLIVVATCRGSFWL